MLQSQRTELQGAQTLTDLIRLNIAYRWFLSVDRNLMRQTLLKLNGLLTYFTISWQCPVAECCLSKIFFNGSHLDA